MAEGLSLRQIGERAGIGKSTVSYHLKRHGMKPANRESRANKGGISREVLEVMLDEGLSIREMADKLERTTSNVRYWLERHSFPPTRTTRNRQIARAARDAGKRRVVMECRNHGMTEFILESRGYHRCVRCRAEHVSEWRRRVKRDLVEEAGGACVTCGYDACIAALQFHHLDRKTKTFMLSRQGVTRSFAEAQAEAKKCILLCANCHAEVESGHRQLPAWPSLAG